MNLGRAHNCLGSYLFDVEGSVTITTTFRAETASEAPAIYNLCEHL
jgi:hypothetical protein